VIGQMSLKQLHPRINLLGQAQFLAHQVHGTDATIVERPAPFDQRPEFQAPTANRGRLEDATLPCSFRPIAGELRIVARRD
jgi:hypothetical protein